MSQLASSAAKMTSRDIAAQKGGRKLTMIAAYDYPIARLVEAAGIDMILVGDSIGMTVLGYESPVPVTLDNVIYHCRAVVRGAPNTHIVADMPFFSYHLTNAGRLLQEGGADSVKLEGGRGPIANRIEVLIAAGIPVMGHIGLTPQLGQTAGFGTQGEDLDSALAIVANAETVAAAGVHSMVVEAVPAELARIVTERVSVPTIGIGAGPDCDGQTVVSTDLVGIESPLFLKFAKRYAELGMQIETAFRSYVAETQSGAFPSPDLSPNMSPDVLSSLQQRLAHESSEDVDLL